MKSTVFVVTLLLKFWTIFQLNCFLLVWAIFLETQPNYGMSSLVDGVQLLKKKEMMGHTQQGKRTCTYPIRMPFPGWIFAQARSPPKQRVSDNCGVTGGSVQAVDD